MLTVSILFATHNGFYSDFFIIAYSGQTVNLKLDATPRTETQVG